MAEVGRLESALYNDETAESAHWMDVDLKDSDRALFELSTFLSERKNVQSDGGKDRPGNGKKVTTKTHNSGV